MTEPTQPIQTAPAQPRTLAVLNALRTACDETAASDLLFLEAWEIEPRPGPAPALRVGQLRRANPLLVAAIRAELATRRG